MNARVTRQRAQVCVGQSAWAAGTLSFVRDGRREYSVFEYDPRWLERRERFELSPDLPLAAGHFTRRAATDVDSSFPGALADTEPDAWGRRVIARAHARRRAHDRSLGALTRFDYLAAVDDESRVGALRLCDEHGTFLRSGVSHRAPPLLDLARIYGATRAVEAGEESADDLAFLQGKATSLGGLRPKCTLRDVDGTLAIGKFPSVADARSIPRGEVLALELMRRADLAPASARLVSVDGTPVAVIGRFDRTPAGLRLPYLSAGSLLLARRDEDRAYTEVVDALRRVGAAPGEDVRLLWRRLVFNLLITNVDDHLWNLGVLYAGDGQWRLAPAFDVNPFPDRARESKTWLSEDTGPITSLTQLLDAADRFGYARADAEREAARIGAVVATWREVATSSVVGLAEHELASFAPAFEHEAVDAARAFASA